MHRSSSSWRPLRSLAIALTVFLTSLAAQAARVTVVKGQQVLVDLQGSSTAVMEGEKYFVVVGGKKKAVITITQVKGGKAKGKILKGRAEVGGSLLAAGGGGSGGGGGRSHSGGGGGMFGDMTIGGLVGFAMDSQTVSTTCGTGNPIESIAMSGSGFSAKGFGDLPISGPLGVIGRAGIEQFNVSGNSTCGGVKTSIMYVTADLLLRYRFMEGSVQPFGQVGLGLHFPMSKTSDVLDVSKISATSVFFFGAGLNYYISPTMYVQALAEYGLFPPSTDVKTSLIAIRGGVGIKF
jgi:hypothetical protein